MSLPLEVLAEAVLRLSRSDRALLLDQVVASLDEDRARDEAWDAIAARRDVEIESGEVDAVDGGELLARLKAELGCAIRFIPAGRKTLLKHSASTKQKPDKRSQRVSWKNSSGS